MKPPFVVMVMGLPGSGKSFFARKLAKKLSARYISSDMIRKSTFEHPQYIPEEKRMVYREMASQMQKALSNQEAAVVDSTFYLKKIRTFMLDKCLELGFQPIIFQVYASENLIRKRVSKKRADSDADYAVYQRLKALSEPLELLHCRLESTNENIEEMLQKAMNYMAHSYDKTRD